MTTKLVLAQETLPVALAGRPFPAVIMQAGPDASRRLVEFFTANIRKPDTKAYARAVAQFLELVRHPRPRSPRASPVSRGRLCRVRIPAPFGHRFRFYSDSSSGCRMSGPEFSPRGG